MEEKDYSNRELDEKFKTILEFLQSIEKQTTKTNGRVSRLEFILLVVGTVAATLIVTKYEETLTVIKLFL